MKMDKWIKGTQNEAVFAGLGRFAECEDVPTKQALELARDFVKRHVRPARPDREYPHWAIDTESLGWVVLPGRRRGDIRLSGALAMALAEAGFQLKPLNSLAVLVQLDLVGMKPPARMFVHDLSRPGATIRISSSADVAAVLDGAPPGRPAPRRTDYFRPDGDIPPVWPPTVIPASVEKLRFYTLRHGKAGLADRLPYRQRVAICLSWLEEFARPAAKAKNLGKTIIEHWSGEYVSQVDFLTAATLLGYEISDDAHHPLGTWKDRKHMTSYTAPGKEVRERVRPPVDLASEADTWARRLGRDTIAPYSEWWPDANPEDVERVARNRET